MVIIEFVPLIILILCSERISSTNTKNNRQKDARSKVRYDTG